MSGRMNSLRRRLSGRRIKGEKGDDDDSSVRSEKTPAVSEPKSPARPRRAHSQRPTSSPGQKGPKTPPGRSRSMDQSSSSGSFESDSNTGTDQNKRGGGRNREGRPNIIQRLRERSRSRSRSRRASTPELERRKEMLVAVTSCRSDGYYNQKAPGSTFKLPRKAPTNLKLFHELAVGVKDAYAAVGAKPRKPSEEDAKKMEAHEYDARTVLWDFVGNLDFVSDMLLVAMCASSCRNTLLTQILFI